MNAEVRDWARAVRSRRAEVLEGIAAGRLDWRAVRHLAATDPLVGAIRVLPVVESFPGVGKVAARRMLAAADVDGFMTLERLDAGVADLLERQVAG